MALDPYWRLADWYDAMYAAMGIKPSAFQNALAHAIHDLLADLGGTEILDCACGTGNPAIGLAKLFPGLRVVGTDGNQKMLARCALNALMEGLSIVSLWKRPAAVVEPSLELGIARWSQLPQTFTGRQFDLVMCRGHSIYHGRTRSQIVETLRKMSAIVRPGGYVLADTLEWAPDFRAEPGRDRLNFRGTLPAEHGLNPAGSDVVFFVTCGYFDDREAVRGV